MLMFRGHFFRQPIIILLAIVLLVLSTFLSYGYAPVGAQDSSPSGPIRLSFNRILYDDRVFTDGIPTDDGNRFDASPACGDDDDEVDLQDHDSNTALTIKIHTLDAATGVCTEQVQENVPIENASNWNVIGYFESDAVIQTTWNPYGVICAPDTDELTLARDPGGEGGDDRYYVRHNDELGECYFQRTSGDLFEIHGENYNTPWRILPADDPHTDLIKGSSLSAATATAPTCASEGADLSWVICPLIFLGDAVLRKLDQAVIGLLSTPNDYFNNDANGLNAAWSQMRNIAYIILVPIVLVMVISTALGFDFISAYTVKRALPRLIIAIIFIALSFEITKFLVVVTNEVGRGIGGIIMSSATGQSTISMADVFSPSGGDGATGLLIGAGLAVGVLALGSIGILLSYLFVAVIALAVGFFLLSLRQMLIIMLMILAPLAILAWIFPGNDKLWKLWWGTFSKLLLLFPLVMVLTSTGKAFAAIIAGTGSAAAVDSSFVSTLIKLIAYVGPYFLIPSMFKFAGGAFASVAGMVNNRERGLFDRQKKYRGQQMGKTWSDTKSGNRFQGSTSQNLRGKLSRGLQGASVVATGGAGYNPLKMRRELYRSVSSAARTEQQELMQNNDDIKSAMVDDDIARAVMHGGNESEVRGILQKTGRFNDPRELDDAVSMARRAQGAGSSRAVKSAMAVGLAGSKTGYDTHSEMYESIIAAADGDTALERALLADTRKASEGVRPDLAAPGYTSSFNALQDVKSSMGTDAAKSTNNRVNAKMNKEAIRQTGAYAMLAGKPSQTVKKEMEQLGNDFQTAVQSGDIDTSTELAAQMKAYRDASGSASPEARGHVVDMLHRSGIDIGAAESVDEQFGSILEQSYHTQRQAATGQVPTQSERLDLARRATQTVRTRAGSYDAGSSSNLTAEQIEERRLRGGGDDPTQR